MTTFEALQTLFVQDLSELQKIQKNWWSSLSTTRVVKEEHLGRCCYLAEEFLGPTDLCTLKQNVGLDEQQWRVYKMRISGS